MKFLDRIALVVVLAMTFPIIISWWCDGWTTRYTSSSYTFADIPNLTGKVAMVTGASSGLGRAMVAELYKKGATVIATARSAQKAQNATRETVKELSANSTAIIGKRTGIVYSQGTPISNVKYNKEKFINMLLDLGSFESIARFVKAFRAKNMRLDVLILNAGIMHTEFSTTTEGFESHFGVNYLGHYLLVKLLMPVLLASNTRVVIITSSAHRNAYYPEGIRFHQLDNNQGFDFSAAYAQSHLALMCFGYRLADEVKRLNELVVVANDVYNDAYNDVIDGSYSSNANGVGIDHPTGMTVNMVHPGLVNTHLRDHLNEYYQSHWLFRYVPFLFAAVDKAAMTPQQGALTPVSMTKLLYISLLMCIRSRHGLFIIP